MMAANQAMAIELVFLATLRVVNICLHLLSVDVADVAFVALVVAVSFDHLTLSCGH
jgi:hypothetical protein